MGYFDKYFAKVSFDTEKLVEYGFKRKQSGYEYLTMFADEQFVLRTIVQNDTPVVDVFDAVSGEKFTPFYVETAEGAFLGDLRQEVETHILKIIDFCCQKNYFKSRQANAVIEYVKTKYGDFPEFLWDDDNAVLRRKDTTKWYAALLNAKKSRFGLNEDGTIELIDFRIDPQELDNIADNERYFRAYHMNKKRWCTVLFNDSVSDEELFFRIDESYKLAKK